MGHITIGGLMKLLLLVLSLISFSVFAEVNIVDFNTAASSYEEAVTPDFSPWIQVAVAGRCFYSNQMDKKTPSVLLPANSEEGVLVAPVTADKHAENFFDNLSYFEIVKKYPQTWNLFRPVFFGENEAVLVKVEGADHYEAQMRESNRYFLMKVFIGKKVFRYCYYVKR
jgi:hypothetical protein